MTKEVMTRKAADNQYLHRDFHNILNLGLDYLADRFGPASVVGYLTDFADHFHAPEIETIQKEGLSAVAAIFQQTYASENADGVLSFEEKEGALLIRIDACPAVRHIRKLGDKPSRFYALTTSIVWGRIARRSGIGFEPLFYDPATGAAEYLFYQNGKAGETKAFGANEEKPDAAEKGGAL